MNIIDLGLIKYNDALKVQLETLDKIIKGETGDTLIIAEHLPVITLGRLASREDILDEGYISSNGIEIIKTNRGGKITYHGPGQLVIYPIIDLSVKRKDVDLYLRFLEDVISEALRSLGIGPCDIEDRTGVWIKGEKIAFIGVAIKKWVSYHGISVNVNNELEPFSSIVPCGEKDLKITSLRAIKGHLLDMKAVKEEFIKWFNKKIIGCFWPSALSMTGKYASTTARAI